MGDREPLVLVVDDEEHITEMLAMGLGFNGFDVERAGTGREALDAIERRRPDLVILLTARDTTHDKVEGLRLGSDDYVTKPFSIEELIERVRAVLRRSSGVG